MNRLLFVFLSIFALVINDNYNMGVLKYFLLMAICLLASCHDTHQKVEGRGDVFHVDLNVKVNPFGEIFSMAEVIPLETADKGLIVQLTKIFPFGGRFYIFDWVLQKVYVFGSDGRYLTRIGKVGLGPDEYMRLNDCYVDTIRQEALFVSAFGSVNVYGLDGTFRDRVVLPSRLNYYSVIPLAENVWATWSHVYSDEDAVLVLDRIGGDTINSYWRDYDVFDGMGLYTFHQHAGKTYFAVPLRHQVYEASVKGLFPAYYWDFGKDNIRDSRLDYYLSLPDSQTQNDELLDDIGTEGLPYIMEANNQNKDYYYVALRREVGPRPVVTHVYYHKQKKRGYVFDVESAGCKILCPLYFGDDYLLTDITYEEREAFRSVLPASEYQKLEAMLEDDNPCLLKLYFNP